MEVVITPLENLVVALKKYHQSAIVSIHIKIVGFRMDICEATIVFVVCKPLIDDLI